MLYLTELNHSKTVNIGQSSRRRMYFKVSKQNESCSFPSGLPIQAILSTNSIDAVRCCDVWAVQQATRTTLDYAIVMSFLQPISVAEVVKRQCSQLIYPPIEHCMLLASTDATQVKEITPVMPILYATHHKATLHMGLGCLEVQVTSSTKGCNASPHPVLSLEILQPSSNSNRIHCVPEPNCPLYNIQC